MKKSDIEKAKELLEEKVRDLNHEPTIEHDGESKYLSYKRIDVYDVVDQQEFHDLLDETGMTETDLEDLFNSVWMEEIILQCRDEAIDDRNYRNDDPYWRYGVKRSDF